MLLLPVLVALFGLQVAVPVLTLTQLSSNASRAWLNRREVRFGLVWRFAVGASPFVALGALLLTSAPLAPLQQLLGILLIALVVWRRVRPATQHQPSDRTFFAAGAASGLGSALLGSVGPLTAPFFLGTGWCAVPTSARRRPAPWPAWLGKRATDRLSPAINDQRDALGADRLPAPRAVEDQACRWGEGRSRRQSLKRGACSHTVLPPECRSTPHCRPLPSMRASPRGRRSRRPAPGTAAEPAVLVGDLNPHMHGVDRDPDGELGAGVQHRVRRQLVGGHEHAA